MVRGLTTHGRDIGDDQRLREVSELLRERELLK
jgi:hypothetical protein